MLITESYLRMLIREEISSELSTEDKYDIEDLESRLADEISLAEAESPGVTEIIQKSFDNIKDLAEEGHVLNVRREINKIVQAFSDIGLETTIISELLKDIQNFYLADKKSTSMS